MTFYQLEIWADAYLADDYLFQSRTGARNYAEDTLGLDPKEYIICARTLYRGTPGTA